MCIDVVVHLSFQWQYHDNANINSKSLNISFSQRVVFQVQLAENISHETRRAPTEVAGDCVGRC